MPNYFDQFDEPAAEAPNEGNFFDQFDPQPSPAIVKQAKPAAAAEEPSLFSQVGRQLGLAGRYGIEGVGNLLGIAADPIGETIDYANGPNRDYQPVGQSASKLADWIGLPKPQGGLEEGVADASRALVGTGAMAGAGLASGASALAEQPLMQALSSITGSASQSIAKEAGAGETGQFLAGLAGGVGPAMIGSAASALTRGAVRGGEAGRKALEDTISDFAAAGTTPSVGQGTQSRALRAAETTLSRAPGAAGPMVRAAERQADEIGSKIAQYADDLAPKTSPTAAGRTIEQGIAGPGGFVDRFKTKAGQLYDAVDQFMPADTPVPLKATQSFLTKAAAPMKGAEKTSALLANPRLGAIGEALGEDLAANNGVLPYQAAKALRTRVGEMISNAGLMTDIPKGELKRLYGALSQDIRVQAANDPKAAATLRRAETYYKAGRDRLDRVEAVVDKAGGPEKIFQAATSGTREGASTLRSVMQSLKPEESRVVASAVVRRLGRANPSAQNDVGDVFSTERFLTNWNGMSPEAKSALFGRMTPQFRSNMDKIAKVASNLREGSGVFKNPSGTAQALSNQTTSADLALAALSGHLGVAAAGGASIAGANAIARLFTSPSAVHWLARQTKLPKGAFLGQVTSLANLAKRNNDDDAADLANLLKQAHDNLNDPLPEGQEAGNSQRSQEQ